MGLLIVAEFSDSVSDWPCRDYMMSSLRMVSFISGSVELHTVTWHTAEKKS
jgi:hypothetical protein